MSTVHAQQIEDLPPPSTARDRDRERALAEAMSSETVTVADPAGALAIELDADDRRALRALFEARARGQRVSVVGYDSVVSPNEAAGLLGVSRPMVYRLIERGDLAATRVGSHWRIRTAQVMDLAHRRQVDLGFVGERLDIAIETGADSHDRGALPGDAKSDWQSLSDAEKEAALDRVRARVKRRTQR
jgi:excisionase family DNA binding protein